MIPIGTRQKTNQCTMNAKKTINAIMLQQMREFTTCNSRSKKNSRNRIYQNFSHSKIRIKQNFSRSCIRIKQNFSRSKIRHQLNPGVSMWGGGRGCGWTKISCTSSSRTKDGSHRSRKNHSRNRNKQNYSS